MRRLCNQCEQSIERDIWGLLKKCPINMLLHGCDCYDGDGRLKYRDTIVKYCVVVFEEYLKKEKEKKDE